MVVSLVIFREIITADPNPHFWIVHTNICAKQIYMQNKHLNYVVLLIFRSRLYEENSVRTIAKEISASQTPKSVKIYAYKNGEGREKEGQLVIGSSIIGVSKYIASPTGRKFLLEFKFRYFANGKFAKVEFHLIL